MKKIGSLPFFFLLLLLGLPVHAANYTFYPSLLGLLNTLPAGCSQKSLILPPYTSYACGVLNLAAGDSITIAGGNPITINVAGAFGTAAGVMINTSGSTSNLLMKVNGAVTLGAGSTLNGNVSTFGAGAVNVAVGSWISGDVSTELGFVEMGAAPPKTGVGGNIRTITGYVGLGAGAYVGGTVNTGTGYVGLGAGATINGAVSTSTGYVGLGAGAIVNGDISTGAAGAVILGANSWAKGSITVNGTTGADYITTADSSKVNCNISTAGSYVTLGANTQVGGSVTAKDYVTVGAGVYLAGNVTSTENYVVVGDGSTVRGKVVFKTYATIDAGAHVYNEVVDTSACGSAPNPSTSAARFECLESASALPARLFTKLAGTPFVFDVLALKTDGTQEVNYVAVGGTAKNVTLELVDGAGSTACASRAAITPTASQALSFAGPDQGRKTTALMTVSKAYRDLRCRVTDTTQTPSLVTCSSDNFAVRPTGLVVTSSANADTAGASASATPAIKAGANFTLTATSNTVGYNTAPQLDASKVAAHAGAVHAGTVAGSFSSADAATGTATGISFSYGEVGYFKLDTDGIYDDAFTAVDSAQSDCTPDFSNNLVGGKYGCKLGNADPTSYVGRFYPDHFALTLPVFAPGCGTFTYMGQSFNLSATVEAQSAGGGKTKNFEGVFASATVTPEIENANNGTPILARLTGLGTPVWIAGAYPFVATGFSRGVTPDGAYDNLDIGLQVNAEAALTATARPYLINRDMAAANTSCTTDTPGMSDGNCTATRIASNAKVRFGQLQLQNAYGSERLPLSVPLQARYWTGSYFVSNTADSCTAVSVPVAWTLSGSERPDGQPRLYFYPLDSGKNELSSANAVPTLQTLTGVATGALSSGQAKLQFAAPQKRGWLDVLLAVPDYLSANWGNCLGQSGVAGLLDDMPCARATFGVYGASANGKSPIIYRRENY